MVNLRQSTIGALAASDAFLWCTGIENTFITAPHPKTGRTLDEYELTGHYDRWRDDLDLIAQLGVSAARYGIPWHRINPRPGVWEWRHADEPLERLLALGITPIVDLVHYGLPAWIEDAFLHPDYPRLVADYAARVADRFKGRIRAYTPLNEPRITAWYCGRLGWWPPFQRSWRGFVAVTLGVCHGIVETVGALRAVDPDILPVHVDATDLYTAADPTLTDEAGHRQSLVFLALDLVSGRITPGHELHAWLRRHGATDSDLAWFQERALDLPFIGLNLYPMFTRKVLARSAAGRQRIAMPYAGAELVEELGQLYWQRYHAPLFIAETASIGSVLRRQQWLDASLGSVRRLRAAGVPLIGYTWWPLFSLVTWAYRQGLHPPEYYFKAMGLWDLAPDGRRLATPLVTAYRRLTAAGIKPVGPLSAAAPSHTSPAVTAL